MRKLADLLSRVILVLCKLCLAAQIAVVSIVVVGRYVFNRTPGWGEGAALFLMVWFGLLSGALAVRGNQHIRIELIEKFLPERANRLLNFGGQIIAAVFGLCLAVGGYRLAVMTRNSVITGLGIKTAWVSASVAVCGALIIIMAIANLCDIVKKDDGKGEKCQTPIWRS